MPTAHSSEFIEEMKQSLLEHKKRLEAELSGLHVHTEIGDDLDEAATEADIDEVNQDLIHRIKADLSKIEAALARITNNTYGVDPNNGESISEDRLRALPWAETAI